MHNKVYCSVCVCLSVSVCLSVCVTTLLETSRLSVCLLLFYWRHHSLPYQNKSTMYIEVLQHWRSLILSLMIFEKTFHSKVMVSFAYRRTSYVSTLKQRYAQLWYCLFLFLKG